MPGTQRGSPALLAVAFIDTSTGNPTSRLWEFGDGNTSAGENTEYTYRRPGTCTANLTINTPAGLHHRRAPKE